LLWVEKTVWPPKFGAGAVHQEDFTMDEFIIKILWRYPAHDQISGSLLYHDRYVYATDNRYHLYGILTTELLNGKPKTVRTFRSPSRATRRKVASSISFWISSA
jgi:hypothetical protein